MSQELKLDPLKPHEVDIARKMIKRNHPLRNVSIFKVLPFLEILTCRKCWKKEEPTQYLNNDEHKLLQFQRASTLKKTEK